MVQLLLNLLTKMTLQVRIIISSNGLTLHSAKGKTETPNHELTSAEQPYSAISNT